MTLLLIHGGLWEDMDAERFWRQPGIVAGFERLGVRVVAPDRVRRAASWAFEAERLARCLPDEPVTVVGGSNGCTSAVRLALAWPKRVEGLVLAWPATAGDSQVDADTRLGLAALGATPEVTDGLLAGGTLRGVTDEELASITGVVGVLPSLTENRFHQRRTVDALLRILPRAVELTGTPEPPHPGFPPYLGSFIRAVLGRPT